MTDPVTPSAPSGKADETPRRRARRTGRFLIVIIAAAAGFAGLLATAAISGGFGYGPGRWHHGGFMGGPMDPASIEKHVDRTVKHLAIEIDATTEQQDRLSAIVKAAVKDLVPMREKALAARQRAREILTQTMVDRAGIEKFRAEHVELIDAATRRIAQALGDAAEVLTPEQRMRIADHLPPGGSWRGWRHD